jgi:hypothetical protein
LLDFSFGTILFFIIIIILNAKNISSSALKWFCFFIDILLITVPFAMRYIFRPFRNFSQKQHDALNEPVTLAYRTKYFRNISIGGRPCG